LVIAEHYPAYSRTYRLGVNQGETGYRGQASARSAGREDQGGGACDQKSGYRFRAGAVPVPYPHAGDFRGAVIGQPCGEQAAEVGGFRLGTDGLCAGSSLFNERVDFSQHYRDMLLDRLARRQVDAVQKKEKPDGRRKNQQRGRDEEYAERGRK